MGNINSSCTSSGDITGTISVDEVLEIISREEAARGTKLALVTDQPSPTEGELPMRLLVLGVEMGNASVEDSTRCWQVVAEPDFWRNHHDIHPGRKRVHTWLFVHKKFRRSAESIVQAAEDMQIGIMDGCEASKTDSACRKVESSFKSLVDKIGKHSEFEDTQLFRFFKENIPETAYQMRALEEDHTEKKLENDARNSISALRSAPTTAAAISGGADIAAAETAVDALKSYVASLLDHLEKEERAIVAKWLNLDPEMYAKYRTYLVGKYRLVY